MDIYSEATIENISSEICDTLQHASFDSNNWHRVAEIFTQRFPGSFTTLICHSHSRRELDFFVCNNLEEHFLDAYQNHYAFVNPWLHVWDREKSGTIRIAEQHSPARLMSGTEFYEDWLIPVGRAEGSAAIKLGGDTEFLAHMPIHYDLKRAPAYDRAVEAVLHRISGTLMMALRTAQGASEAWQRASAQTAIKMRSEPVFVVDGKLRILDTNFERDPDLRHPEINVRGGILRLEATSANSWLSQTLALAETRSFSINWSQAFETASGPLLIEIVPLKQPNFASIFPVSSLYAVVLRSPSKNGGAGDIRAFADLYRLTPAEMRLCEFLAEGLSLAEAADTLELTQGTVRVRLKRIFQKTDTHRQGQLVSLLSKFQR